MKHAITIRTIALAGLLFAGCSTIKGAVGLEEEEPAAYPWEGAPQPVDAPLLARDGGVVEGPGSGTTSVGAGPHHGVQTSTEGRMYIVELYQRALDERDGLQLEVGDLVAALEQSQVAAAALAAELEAQRAETARLTVESESLKGMNIDLAGRLATAQLRRLEADKLLLEERLNNHPSEGLPAALGGATEGLAGALAPSGTPVEPSAWDLALGGDSQ